MSLINTRAPSASATFSYLQRSVLTFESNCARIVDRLHKRYALTAAPAPSITDAVATLADGDDVLAAQLFGGKLNPDIEAELADTVASSFAKYRGDLTPSPAQLFKVVGRRLGNDSYALLSLTDKLAITRTLSAADAKALCQKRIDSHKAAMRMSVATL